MLDRNADVDDGVFGTLPAQVRHGLIMLSQRILGPNTIIQGAVKMILNSTPQQFFNSSISLVQVSLCTNPVDTCSAV